MMKRGAAFIFITLLVGVALGLPSVARAQQRPPAPASVPAATPALSASGEREVKINLKDGSTVITTGLRRTGDTIMARVQVGSAQGEAGYAVAMIRQIEFPEPLQLRPVTDLLEKGKAAEALAQIEPVVSYYTAFKDVPGNRWAEVALLKLNALIALGRDRDAEALVGELSRVTNNPQVVQTARVQMAANWARKGDFARALPVFDEIIKGSTDPEALALAWLNKGHAFLARKEWEPALLAYLHLPVFYPNQKLHLPAAMLGSGRAFVGINDLQKAQEAFNELIAAFPASPEAAAAKTELQKLGKTLPAPGAA